MSRSKYALLFSGGIGDFLYYVCRTQDFLKQNGLSPSDVTIFIETTRQAHQIETLFQVTLHEIEFRLIPSSLHWTRTNPLIVPNNEYDRINRPAYQYVLQRGYQTIVDWFLPFLCTNYSIDPSPLMKLASKASSVYKDKYVMVSLRDKGLLWWPGEQICLELQALIPKSYTLIYVGNPDETLRWAPNFTTFETVADALSYSYNAELFIGVDTGLGTMRELTGRENFYCVTAYWFNELMLKYGYWCEQVSQKSLSTFVYSDTELFERLKVSFKFEK